MKNQIDWDYFYKNYIVNKELIWLNNCGTTPVSTDILNEVKSYLDEYSKKGVLVEKFRYYDVRNKITNLISKLIGCKQEEIALIHNTAEGMNYISHGLQLNSGDEILLLENEYPSNVYPWELWKERGVTIQFIPLGEHPIEFLENTKKMITSKTKLISISGVHWCTGMPLPLEEIGNLCKEHGIEFALDGAQIVGHIPMDVVKMNIDYMCFPAWKWLLGPIGMGVMYVSEKKLNTLKLSFKGQNSVVQAGEYLPYKETLKPTAERFECSTQNFSDWIYLLASLEILDKIGFETVQDRVFELAGYLSSRLRNIGCRILSDKYKEYRTCMVIFDHHQITADKIFQKFKDNNVICALRLGRIRISPHIYNSTEQMDKVVQLVKSVIE